jgi:hypothetical protein
MALAGGTTGHKYKRLTTASDWNTQLNACAATSLNAYLAIPDDQTELDALGTFASAVIWVGIDDLANEGMYMTVKNQPATFLPWAAGEPNNGPPEEDCVSADDTTSTLLSTDRCSLVYIAICECEP